MSGWNMTQSEVTQGHPVKRASFLAAFADVGKSYRLQNPSARLVVVAPTPAWAWALAGAVHADRVLSIDDVVDSAARGQRSVGPRDLLLVDATGATPHQRRTLEVIKPPCGAMIEFRGGDYYLSEWWNGRPINLPVARQDQDPGHKLLTTRENRDPGLAL